MNQKATIILSTIVTTFSLVVLGGVVGRASSPMAAISPDTTVSTQQAPPQNANYLPQYEAVPAQTPAQVPASTVAITSDQAALIALSNAPGASLTKTPELVDFEGSVAYEVMLNNGTLYVNANDGQVLYNSLVVSATANQGYEGEEYEEEEYEEGEEGEEGEEYEEDEHEENQEYEEGEEHEEEEHEEDQEYEEGEEHEEDEDDEHEEDEDEDDEEDDD